MRVRTTQELLDSQLVLIGWRVYVERDKPRMYATGNGHWTPLKDRAFLFTDAPHSARKGNDDGLRWARAHARHLADEYAKKCIPIADAEEEDVYDVLKPIVVCVRKRVWPKGVRSSERPWWHPERQATMHKTEKSPKGKAT